MILFFKYRLHIVITICIGVLFWESGAVAVMDPRFELDSETLSGLKSAAKPRQVVKKRSSRSHAGQASSARDKGGVYTVKPGDHLFKILMRDYALTSYEAELFVEEIRRENNIYDIKRLKIGQKIVIPPVRRSSDGKLKVLQPSRVDIAQNSGSGAIPEQSFKLESPLPALTEQEAVTRTQQVWGRIVPTTKELQKPISLQTNTFSLILDPERYPVFARMDGGRIILDQNGSIPPLVKSLIEDKDASVRIVSVAPSDTRRFMASLLESAGFYSVEENFSMEFGVDPKLTVQADFKVEKTAESLIKQDVILVNSGFIPLPSPLGAFLKNEGFSLYEPFSLVKPLLPRESRSIHYISARKQPEMVDSILSAFSVASERDRSVEVFEAENIGISLSVKAERYFERGGQRYVVSSFDGDPISYTLFRLLETRGYKVVIIEAQDDFRSISEKILSRMKIKGDFAQHNLVQTGSAGYSLQMSGFKLDDATLPGGGIFLTDRFMDHIIRDLFTENGFSINSR